MYPSDLYDLGKQITAAANWAEWRQFAIDFWGVAPEGGYLELELDWHEEEYSIYESYWYASYSAVRLFDEDGREIQPDFTLAAWDLCEDDAPADLDDYLTNCEGAFTDEMNALHLPDLGSRQPDEVKLKLKRPYDDEIEEYAPEVYKWLSAL